jgi:two-component system, chemotaxis family, sensor kinase CheA
MSDLEIVKEFLVESYENLDRLDRNLVELEKHPADREILADIFRTIHTIKGTSGFLAFPKLEAVAHVGENLLARLRDGQLRLNPEITTALLSMVDAVRQMLETIGANGTDGNNDYKELIGCLRILQEGNPAALPTVETPRPVPEAAPPAAPPRTFSPSPADWEDCCSIKSASPRKHWLAPWKIRRREIPIRWAKSWSATGFSPPRNCKRPSGF